MRHFSFIYFFFGSSVKCEEASTTLARSFSFYSFNHFIAASDGEKYRHLNAKQQEWAIIEKKKK